MLRSAAADQRPEPFHSRPLKALPALLAAALAAGCSPIQFNEPPEEARIEQATLRSTVRIRAIACGTLSTGSGLLTGEGAILTSRHVIERASSITVTTWDGHDHSAAVSAVGERTDLAKLESPTLAIKGLLDSRPEDRPRQGSPIITAGHHNAGPLTVRTGRITGTTHTTGNEGQVYSTDIAVRPGASGGPAVSLHTGRAFGIVFAYDDNTGDGLIIPIEQTSDLEAYRPDQDECAQK